MSKLDEYISKLLRDDHALKDFLVNPIEASEDQNGLTKAQRSVLRRTVDGLSNNSTNGYNLARHLDSYRRSIRLLQNVLHTERGSAVSNLRIKEQHTDLTASYHYLYLYYNGVPSNPKGANPYSYYIAFFGYGSTIGEVMKNAYVYNYSKGTYDYINDLTTFDPSGQYVLGFDVPAGFQQPGSYKAVPVAGSSNAFWFYSVNGRAVNTNVYNYLYGDINPYAGYGNEGESFQNYALSPNSTIFWQLIAPGPNYGFHTCDTATLENTF
ncbi:MAG: hypothetical protein WBA74_01375 [Cyclobacteriaceae bacterium]